jgi:Tfp pilus assembly protein PilN
MEQQVNLYQPILGAEKRFFSALTIGTGLAVLVLCLMALLAFGAWRTHRIERSIGLLERQEVASLDLATRANAAMRPAQTLEQLEAEAKELSAEIAARERALDIVQRGAATPGSGFAARLEALARPQLEGLWLSGIVLGSGEGRLAMRGGSSDANLVPVYLAALAQDPALAGVRYDRFALRRALPEDAPARMVFELDAPGLKFTPRESLQ